MAKVAILGGFGNIGTGLTTLLLKKAATITASAGEDITIKYVVDIAAPKNDEYKGLVTSDFAVVENDPEIEIVIEVMGGTRIAYGYTKRALLAGKSVVTSNKELVAAYGMELVSIAKERGVNYLFEAAVGGGIPLIHPLNNCFTANDITEIYGILNGTTNYILTRMFSGGVDFDTALEEAKFNGYAEPNPAADIEGTDVCRKISILASLAYGKYASPEKIKTIGITGIKIGDISLAAKLGYTVKLLGRVVKNDDGSIYIIAAPHLVSSEEPIAAVSGVFNAACIIGDMVDKTMFYGRGAGPLPTASAIASDIIELVNNRGRDLNVGWSEAEDGYIADCDEMKGKIFIRIAKDDCSKVKALFADAENVCCDAECGFIIDNISVKEAEIKLKDVNILSLIRVL